MVAPKVEHWTATKRMSRFVKWGFDFGIVYKAKTLGCVGTHLN